MAARPIQAHFIHRDRNEMVAKRLIDHAPSVGDELRFAAGKFFKVVLLVWVFDEPDHPYARLNIGVVDVDVKKEAA